MKWIDEIILGLTDTYGTNNSYELCRVLNILIIKVNPFNRLLNGEPSLYIRNLFEIGREAIIIMNNLHYSYEKFYIMHELGHAILHPNIINSWNENLANIGKLEKQANYFAFKLSKLKFDPISMKNFTIEQIASCLKVPEKALKQLVNI